MLHFFDPAPDRSEEHGYLTRDDSTAFAPPPAFGPFRVLHQIGVGALGPVFRTYEPTRDRLVAVKVFRLDITPEQAQALADELGHAAQASLFHPSIVEPIAAGIEGTVAYRAEEYVAAESLDVAMRHYAPASPDQVLPFIAQLAGAIDMARSSGVGHGALHPRDIFVTPDEARATGFGVVDALENVGLRAPVRRPYSPPERIAGVTWTTAADVFSLAAIAFELLTGRRPAGTSAQIGLLAPSLGDRAAPMHEVLVRAMDQEPSRRHQTAMAFSDALEIAAVGFVSSKPDPSSRIPDRPLRPRPGAPASGDDAPASEARLTGVGSGADDFTRRPSLGDADTFDAPLRPREQPDRPDLDALASLQPSPGGDPLDAPLSREAPDPFDDIRPMRRQLQREKRDRKRPERTPMPDPTMGDADRAGTDADRALLEQKDAAPAAGDPIAAAAGIRAADHSFVQPRASSDDPVVEDSVFDALAPAAERDDVGGAAAPDELWTADRDRDEGGLVGDAVDDDDESVESERQARTAGAGAASEREALRNEATQDEAFQNATIDSAAIESEDLEMDDGALERGASRHMAPEDDARVDEESLDTEAADSVPSAGDTARDGLTGLFADSRRRRAGTDGRDRGGARGAAQPGLGLSGSSASAFDMSLSADPPSDSVDQPRRVVILPLALAAILGLLLGFAAGYFVGYRATEPAAADASTAAPSSTGAAETAPTPAPTDQPASVPPAPSGTADPPRVPSETADTAPPPAAASARTGTLNIRSAPSGAAVTVNGTWSGRTPLTLADRPFRSYAIRIVLPGHEVATSTVGLSPEDPARTVSVELKRSLAAKPATQKPPAAATPPAGGAEPEPRGASAAPGSIFVDSRPTGARVFVDGKEVGTTPLRLPGVAPGSYAVRLELADHQSWTTTARVVAGQQARVTGSLERIR